MTTELFPRIRAMGDAALLVELGNELAVALNARVHALARHVEGLHGVAAVVPGYTTLLVEYEPDAIQAERLQAQLVEILSARAEMSIEVAPRLVEIPTRYGGEFGPDLDFVAAHNNLSAEEVVRIHTGETYQVFMVGFAPGFPYLGILPEKIAAPRLESPRKRVPAGSVGLAGRQTGIYPRESPGGWRLIGRTDVKLFDPADDPPTLLRAGDRVRFVAC